MGELEHNLALLWSWSGANWPVQQLFQPVYATLHDTLPFPQLDSRLAWPDRPPLRLDLEQLPCLPETAWRRAAMPVAAPVLCLGDDDLVSVALRLRGYQGPLTVVDVDERLLDYLRTLDLDLELQCMDLREQRPHGRYATVFTDPPYEEAGFRRFLEIAKSLGEDIYLSTRPDARIPLKVGQHWRNFNRYPYEGWEEAMLRLARIDFCPELAAEIFRTPCFYADLWRVNG